MNLAYSFSEEEEEEEEEEEKEHVSRLDSIFEDLSPK